MNTDNGLEAQAQRARLDPLYLGHVLELHARARGLSEQALLERLGVTAPVLVRLRLCKAPRDQQAVLDVAAYLGVNPAALMEVTGLGE